MFLDLGSIFIVLIYILGDGKYIHTYMWCIYKHQTGMLKCCDAMSQPSSWVKNIFKMLLKSIIKTKRKQTGIKKLDVSDQKSHKVNEHGECKYCLLKAQWNPLRSQKKKSERASQDSEISLQSTGLRAPDLPYLHFAFCSAPMTS